MPTITEIRLNSSNFKPTIKGIAIKMYLKIIEQRDRKKVFLFDFPIRRGIDSPISIKLMMLKRVPNMSPFPTAALSIIMNTNADRIAKEIA